jgi:hypothetical protein
MYSRRTIFFWWGCGKGREVRVMEMSGKRLRQNDVYGEIGEGAVWMGRE